jgi:uncharacterized membrane protein (DUF4010 family)
MNIPTDAHWPYLATLTRLALALGLGLFVGMERERRGKEAGMRTFGFTALLGCLGGLLGDAYALCALALIGVLVVFLNWQRLTSNGTAELTTSVALLVTGVAGVLAGKGHTFTPVTVGVATAALLAWKERMIHFSLGLTEAEIRSAILLALITFVVYPVLPARPLDGWGLIVPRDAWMTVILIAALGFVNYVLWKRYGARGMVFASLLGGLVNSTVAVTELATRLRSLPDEGEASARMADLAYRGILLATAAMLVRNALLLGILAPRALVAAGVSLALMLSGVLALALMRFRSSPDDPAEAQRGEIAADENAPSLPAATLESPFSLTAALKYGLVFLGLHVAGVVAQRLIGAAGFYMVSFAGGLVSSASSVASAAMLAAQGRLPDAVAADGALLATLSSALINLPLVARVARRRPLTARLSRALGLVLALGAFGAGSRAAFDQIARWVH